MAGIIETALRRLRDDGPSARCSGICYNLQVIAAQDGAGQRSANWLVNQFEAMGLDPAYPIDWPGQGPEDNSGMWAYDHHHDLWSGDEDDADLREYGRRRWAMLDTLIERATEQGA